MSAPAAADAVDALVGARVDGRYRIERVLARGGMSVVYAALHEQQQREVAIKVLDEAIASDPEAVERFMHEARTASSLSHGHVVGVSDFGRLPDGRPYLVMPLIGGTDMATLLAQEGPQPPRRVAALLAGVGSALDAMHEKGFVHRDIKSENLMHIRGEDGTETVLVLDFGIAAVSGTAPALRGGASSSGTAPALRGGAARHSEGGGSAEDASGTPEFMAPEVLAGAACDHRSDVYSLATVAFELISGSLPFGGEDLPQFLQNKKTRGPRTLSEAAGASFPDALERVLARGLAQDPEQRQRSAGELVRELEGASAGLSSSPVKAGARKPRPPRSRTLVGTGNAARGGAASSLPASLRAHRDTNPGYSSSEPAVEEAERTGTRRRLDPIAAPPVEPSVNTGPAPIRPGGNAAAVASAALAAAARSKRATAAKRAGPESAAETAVTVRLSLPPVVAPPPRVGPSEPVPPAGDLGVAPELEAAQRFVAQSPFDPRDIVPPPSGTWPQAEDSLQPPPELDVALDPDARGLRGRLLGLHWLAYPTIAGLIALAVMVFDRSRPTPAPAADPTPAAAASVPAEAAAPAPPIAAPAATAVSPSATSAVVPAPTAGAIEPAPAARRPEAVKAPRASAVKARRSKAAAVEPATRTSRTEPATRPSASKPAMDGTAPALRGGASIDGTAPALRGGALIDGTAPALRGGALVGSARESAAALTQRATDAMLRGNFQAADAAYQQAIAADPRHAPAFRGRGLLLERMDRPKDAARAFRQFLKLSPGGSGADKIRARLSALESQ